MVQPFWHLFCGFLIKKTIGLDPKRNEIVFVPGRIYLFYFFNFFYLKSSEGGGAAAVCAPLDR